MLASCMALEAANGWLLFESYRGQRAYMVMRNQQRAKKRPLHILGDPSSEQRHHIFHEDCITRQGYGPISRVHDEMTLVCHQRTVRISLKTCISWHCCNPTPPQDGHPLPFLCHFKKPLRLQYDFFWLKLYTS